jgi:hypothetical protein
MKTKPIILASLLCASFALPALADDPVPCEDILATLRETIKTATLSDADKAKVTDLEDQGIERCNADDDVNADALFAETMKIMGK